MKFVVLTIGFEGYLNSQEFNKKVEQTIKDIKNDEGPSFKYEDVYLESEKGNYKITIYLSKVNDAKSLLKHWEHEIVKCVFGFSKKQICSTITESQKI